MDTKLRELREVLNKTQKEFATELGIGRQRHKRQDLHLAFFYILSLLHK